MIEHRVGGVILLGKYCCGSMGDVRFEPGWGAFRIDEKL
jgi:hypothetical protein